MQNNIKTLNKTVILLGLVSLFADISSEMLYPITPIFLTGTLGASMFALGIIEGIAEGIAGLLKTFSGVWSDRIEKRKNFICLGYFLGAISKPFIGIATLWPHVLFARSIDRFGKGIRSSPRDALIAESVLAHQRGAAFGWHRAMDTLGAAIGPLLAIIGLSYINNLREFYLWALIPGLISVLFTFFITEKQSEKQSAKTALSVDSQNLRSQHENPVLQSLRFAYNHFDPGFKKFCCAWFVFAIANSSDVFLILKAKSIGLSLTQTTGMYCFYNLVYSLSSPYLGKLSDQISRKIILIFGLLIFTMVYLGFSVAHKEWHFWILFAIYGLYMAATDGVSKAFTLDLIDSHLKATGLGILGTITSFGTIIASAMAGLIWDFYGAQYVFIFGAAGALATTLILLIDNSIGSQHHKSQS